MSASSQGQFVWHELLTSDSSAAIEFYAHVVGWTTQLWGDGSNMDYKMWVGSQGPLGGVMNLMPEMKAAGIPPHWNCNVTVADVDAAVARLDKLGGKLIAGPHDMPSVGRFALVSDPHGGMLSLFKPEGAMSPKDGEQVGAFCWAELGSPDHKASFAFYSALLGWEKLGTHDMGDMGEYLLFGTDGKQLGGMFTSPPGMPTAWCYYINVGDLDAALARATERGAKVLNGPMPIPGGARIAQLLDAQGAYIAILGG